MTNDNGTNDVRMAWALDLPKDSVIVLDGKTEGPLFLTINNKFDQFGNHDKKVTVTVEQARS